MALPLPWQRDHFLHLTATGSSFHQTSPRTQPLGTLGILAGVYVFVIYVEHSRILFREYPIIYRVNVSM